MATVEIDTGKYVKRYDFWNPATWAIPKLYWDAYSQEQRIHAICRQLEKVIRYADYVGVNVDDIAQRLQDIEDGKLDEFIVTAIEQWFEENEPQIIQALEDLDGKIDQNYETLDGKIDQNYETLDGKIDANTEKDQIKTRLQQLVQNCSNNAPWRIWDMFRTYIPHSSEFHYGAGSFLTMDYDETEQTWSPATIEGEYVNGIATFGASCSTAVEACICGIPYENSRMATGSIVNGTIPLLTGGLNYPVSGAWNIDIYDPLLRSLYSEDDYVTYASELGKWLNDAGLLRRFETRGNLNELAPGDIIFFVNDDNTDPMYWENIDHVCFYIAPWYGTGATVAEITTISNPLWFIGNKGKSYFDNAVFYARIPMSGNDYPENILRYPIDTFPDGYTWSGTGLGALHSLPFKKKPVYDTASEGVETYNRWSVKPWDVYTLLVHATDVTGDRTRLAVTAYDRTENQSYSAMAGNIVFDKKSAHYLGNDWYWCSLWANDLSSVPDDIVLDGIGFRATSDTTYSVTIDDMRVYNKLIMPTGD